MKPAPLAFVRPTELGDALAELAADPHAKVLAGGQSLLPLLSMRLAAPTTLVDINALPGLTGVEAYDDGVRVGALARHADVLADAAARRVQPLLGRALRLVAHPTIRNRGTTVGSLVHADAAAEMPAVLALLGGTVTAVSVRGERVVPAAELFVGPMESSLAQDEISVAASFPALAAGAGVACDEVSRRHGDYALCGVAALVEVAPDGAVIAARAAYFSVAEVPVVVDLTTPLGGSRGGSDALDDAVAVAVSGLSPEADIHATADYRRHLAGVLTRRVLRAAYDDAVARRGAGAA